MKHYEPKPLTEISEAAEMLCRKGRNENTAATMNFNGINLTAQPDSDPKQIVDLYYLEMGKRDATIRALDDGVFPQQLAVADKSISKGGISLRAYIATRAMQTEIETACRSAENAKALAWAAGNAGMTIHERIAYNACRMADALIAELNKPAK